ncbi:heterokaryon incompatibility protein (HET) domain-containing protein [Paramyrothecium foliicola]|nr:heterokaryon incompatibility protein (HET) domain-containing protein [Paramyrothecium foliicola]
MDPLDSLSELFTYTPLSTHESIRVVALLPGQFEDAIDCEIFHTSTNSEARPAYEALSYVWGDANDIAPIILNGSRFFVTVNLECALRYLRLPDTQRLLWIDAICINQQDDREKEVQVRGMAAVYKQSAKVLLWLGEETNHLMHQERPPPMPISEVFEMISKVANGQSITHLVGDDPWARWTPSLLDFLRRVWFTRLWVVQETAMTFEPVMICGKASIPWTHLFAAQRHIGPTLGFTAYGAVSMRAAFHNFDAMVNCWTAHQYWKGDKNVTAEELARRLIRLLFALGGSFLCSDERDRLYGILGMVGHPELSKQIPVDYQKSAAMVFRDLAVFLIESRKSLDFLVGDRASFDASGYPGKPSWAPTWKAYSTYTRRIYTFPSAWTRGEEEEPRSGALADYRLSEDHNVLYVKGVVLGRLIGIGTPPPYHPNDNPTASSRAEHRKALSQLLLMRRTRGAESIWGNADDVEDEIVPLPSLRDSYGAEKELTSELRSTLFHSSEPGSRSGSVSEDQCYEILLGRRDSMQEDEDKVNDEIERFAYFKWRDIHDMVPFRLSSGHFGMFELDIGVYDMSIFLGDLLIVLLAGGPGPVVICKLGLARKKVDENPAIEESPPISVLYLTDGNSVFLSALESLRRHLSSHQSTISAGLIVAVGYPLPSDAGTVMSPRRTTDLTPPSPGCKPSEGGADVFLEFLQSRVKPFVHQRLNNMLGAKPSKEALYGHSYGGLFSLHTLFTRPGMFDCFIASSPSIWWNSEYILGEEKLFREGSGSDKPDVMLFVGGLEQEPPRRRGESEADYQTRRKRHQERRMVENLLNQHKRLCESDRLDNVAMRVYDGEDHDWPYKLE